MGSYTYPATGQPRPHAVSSISGGLISTTFTYDAKGSMTAGNGLTIAYTSYGKTSSISRGTATVTFEHDPEHQRFSQVGPGGTTYYLSSGAVLAERVAGSGGSVTWNHYLVAAGGTCGSFDLQSRQGKGLELLSHPSHIAGMQLAAARHTKILVNGEASEATAATLAGLVAELGYGESAVATAVNGEFVPRHARAAIRLSPGDRVEIVAPRQGG